MDVNWENVEPIMFGYQISLAGVEHFLKNSNFKVDEYLIYFYDPKDVCGASSSNQLHGKVSLLWSAARATHMNKDQRYKVIQILLKSGANSYFFSRLGWSPYEVAKRYVPDDKDALSLLWRPSLLSFVTLIPLNNEVSRTPISPGRESISLGHPVASALDVHRNRTARPFFYYSKFHSFQNSINQRASRDRMLLLNVFVHEVGVSFEEALDSTARLGRRMTEDEMINIGFSLDGCRNDSLESASRAIEFFVDFILKLDSAFTEKKINLFGHGMGCRIVLSGLQNLLREDVRSIRTVIISSPDLDQLTLQTEMENLQLCINENSLLDNPPFFALLCSDPTFASLGKYFRPRSASCLPEADGCVTFLVQNAKEYDDHRVTDPTVLYLIAHLFHSKPSKGELRQTFDRSLSGGLIIPLVCGALDLLSNLPFGEESGFSSTLHGPSDDAISYREQAFIVLDGYTRMSDYREVTELPGVRRPTKKRCKMFAWIACGILVAIILVGSLVSVAPSSTPTIQPTAKPTLHPSIPTIQPTPKPTFSPIIPTPIPTNHPTLTPTLRPTPIPSVATSRPTPKPTAAPTALCNSVSYNPRTQQCCNGSICSLSDKCSDCGCLPQGTTKICCSGHGLKKTCQNTEICCFHFARLDPNGALGCCAPGNCDRNFGC